MAHRVASSQDSFTYFKITYQSVTQLVRGVVNSPFTQIACPVLFEVCPLMVRVRTMLLVRKSRKLVAQHASERQHTLMPVSLLLIRCPCRNTNTSLVDTMLGDLYRTRGARTISSQVDRKVYRCERP